MNDMTQTIMARSDQLNSDDLVSGPITIKITDARVMMAEQPCVISYEGDNGKPYKPGKSMRRVLVAAWGTDPKSYIGRSLTLYRDPDVSFGGVKVGGTRISHMSHIESPLLIALTVTRGSKKPFKVQPLVIEEKKVSATLEMSSEEISQLHLAAEDVAMLGTNDLKKFWSAIGGAKQKAIGGADKLAKLKIIAAKADQENSPPQSSGDEETPFDV